MGWHFKINIYNQKYYSSTLKICCLVTIVLQLRFPNRNFTIYECFISNSNTHCMTVLNRELTLTTSLTVCYCCRISSSTQNGDMGPRRDSSVSGSSVGGLSRIPTIAKGSQLSMQSSFNLDIDSARGTPVRSMKSPVQAMENKKKVHIKRLHLKKNQLM